MQRDELEWRRRRQKRRRHRQQKQHALHLLAVVLILVCSVFAGASAIHYYTSHPPVTSAAPSIRTCLRAYVNNVVLAREAQEAQSEPESDPEPVVPVDPNSIIYLTFDDGPSSQVTPTVLDVLERNDIQATFFIMDYSEENLPIIQRILAGGNTIGIHGKSHDYAKCYAEEDAYLDGVAQVRQHLYADTGYDAFCIRFPGGSSNTISRQYNEGIMTRLVAKVNDSGLEYFDWNVDSQDATGNGIPAETLAANVTDNLVKGRGNVVLLHDAGSKATTAESLQSIIDYARANGFCFKAITQDTPPVHHRVYN